MNSNSVSPHRKYSKMFLPLLKIQKTLTRSRASSEGKGKKKNITGGGLVQSSLRSSFVFLLYHYGKPVAITSGALKLKQKCKISGGKERKATPEKTCQQLNILIIR